MTRLIQALPKIAEALRRPGVSVVVTGGGGWLGRAAVELLDGIYDETLPRHVAVFARTPRRLDLASGRSLTMRPLEELAGLDFVRPYVLHFAFLGREKAEEAAFVAANRRIGDIVAEALGRHGASGLFVPSSGAVYRADRTLDRDLEGNPYGVLKLEDEERFGALGLRLGIPVTVLRVFNLGGPFINKLDGYALATILRDIGRGGPVRLLAAKPVIRSYVHVADVLNAALADLVDGAGSGPLDTAGEHAVEIGELAHLAATVLGAGKVDIVRPDFDGAGEDRYVGDGAEFAALTARHGITPITLERQIADTAAYLAGLQG